MYWEKYVMPRTVEEVLTILRESGGKARVVAGGTDLFLRLKEGKMSLNTLVDISRVRDLRFISEENGWIRVGALCTHADVALSPLIQTSFPALAQAAQAVGSPQIRNVGTIGGNVVNAQPAADTAVALTALQAQVKVISENGIAVKPIGELFCGVGESAVDSTVELVTEFILRSPDRNETSNFQRLARRKALALPTLNVAVSVALTEDMKTIKEVCIAAGPVDKSPWRARAAEESLVGAAVTQGNIKAAGDLAALAAKPRDSLRGSAKYRKDMLKVLISRALTTSINNLGGVIFG